MILTLLRTISGLLLRFGCWEHGLWALNETYDEEATSAMAESPVAEEGSFRREKEREREREALLGREDRGRGRGSGEERV